MDELTGTVVEFARGDGKEFAKVVVEIQDGKKATLLLRNDKDITLDIGSRYLLKYRESEYTKDGKRRTSKWINYAECLSRDAGPAPAANKPSRLEPASANEENPEKKASILKQVAFKVAGNITAAFIRSGQVKTVSESLFVCSEIAGGIFKELAGNGTAKPAGKQGEVVNPPKEAKQGL